MVHCVVVACTSAVADFAVGTEALPVIVRFALLGRTDAGLSAIDLRAFFSDRIASFMALAPVRRANRAMALSERWSERLKIGTYACLADHARNDTGRGSERVARSSPAICFIDYIAWAALHLFGDAHTDLSGLFQAAASFQERKIGIPGRTNKVQTNDVHD